MEVQTLLVNAATAALAAIGSAGLTLLVSLKRFRSERWWERQSEAYSAIISHLVDALHYTELWLSYAEESRGEYPQLPQSELSRRSDTAWRELRRLAGIGAFVISEDAAAILETIEAKRKEWDLAQLDPVEEAEERRKILGQSIVDIRRIAKRDLRWDT